jgi:hypothetical protein
MCREVGRAKPNDFGGRVQELGRGHPSRVRSIGRSPRGRTVGVPASDAGRCPHRERFQNVRQLRATTGDSPVRQTAWTRYRAGPSISSGMSGCSCRRLVCWWGIASRCAGGVGECSLGGMLSVGGLLLALQELSVGGLVLAARVLSLGGRALSRRTLTLGELGRSSRGS